MAKKKQVSIGIVGVGNMGSAHIGFIETLKCAKIGALCDVNASQIEKYKGKYPLFYDAEKMFKSGKIDAVIIAVPHYFHVPMAISAMKHGLHVIVEKPVAVQKSEVRKLNRAIKAHPELKVAAMFCRRTIPTNIKIKELIDSGALGKIKRITWTVTDWFRTQAYYNSGGWRATWKGEGGGVLMNQCPHQIDLLQWFFGMPKTVYTDLTLGKYHDIEVEDDVTTVMKYANGATCVFITSTGEAPGLDRLDVCADNGRLICENNTLTFYKTEMPVSKFSKTCKSGFGTPKVEKIEFKDLPKEEQMHTVITRNFCESILNGTPLIACAAEGINEVELNNAMMVSGITGKTVKLPQDPEVFDKLLAKLTKKSKAKKTVVAVKNDDFSKSY